MKPLRCLAAAAALILALAACAPRPVPQQSAPQASGGCAVPARAGEATRAVIAELNTTRARTGLPPVRHDPHLARAARAHACDMAGRGYFSHRAPDGGRLPDRLALVGYRGCAGAENLARGQLSAAETVRDWMGSRDHRRNVLRDDLPRAGAALASPRRGGQLHWVLVMGRPC